jgi:ParB-like chromosome segregation protein Spo0J
MARFIARTKLNINDIKEVEEYKALIPENNQYEELKRAIKDQGFLFPVIVNKNGELLDGYTRLKIARELGITEIPAEVYETGGREDELDIIASLNLKRRHLTKDELVLLIDKIHEMKKRLKKDNIDEQNRSSPATILPVNADKISTRQESREIKEELKRLVPDVQINEETIRKYLQVKKEAPWLVQYIGDKKKGKIGIEKAYDIYLLLKEKNLLDLDKRIPKPELSKLVTDKNGRKVLERDDLLQLILDHKMAVSQAINKLKTEEKQQRSKKKSTVEAKDLNETKNEGEEIETIHREDSESNEYPFGGEWQKAKEEGKTEQQLTPQLNEKDEEEPSTRTEIYMPKADLDALYRAMPSIKRLVDEGRLTEKDAEKVYEIWRNMEAIYKQASLLWYNTVDILLKRAGLSDREREQIFYEMVRSYFKLFPREEVFPREVLEGTW